MNILVVEADHDLANGLYLALAGPARKVRIVHSVWEAEKSVVDKPPNVMILDFHAGAEAEILRLVRLTLKLWEDRCKIIVTTTQESVVKALTGNTVLLKPFKVEDLLTVAGLE